MKNYYLFTFAASLFAAATAIAQGSLENYRRAYSIGTEYSSRNVINFNVRVQWLDGGPLYWYPLQTTGTESVYYVGDASKGSCVELFSMERLTKQMTDAIGSQMPTGWLSSQALRVSDHADTLHFFYDHAMWTYSIADQKLVKEAAERNEGRDPRRRREAQRFWSERDEGRGSFSVPSPDTLYSAFVKENNLYIMNKVTGEEKQITTDGTQENYYSAYLQWSPDSKWVAAMKVRPVKEKRYVYYVESSPKDQLQPKLHKQEYAKPGDELPFKTPCLFEVATGKAVIPSTDLFASQYELNGLRWNEDGRAVTFEYNQRGHQIYRVLELSVDGAVRPIVEENSKTFVNYNRRFRQDLKNGTEMIWMSERDNWNHLYMIDRITGKVKHQITKGEWYVRRVLDVDENKKQIYFTANGKTKDVSEDPYLIRYYRIDFSGKNLVCLTPETGNHSAQFSKDKKYLIDTYSTVDTPPVTVLRNGKNGKILRTIAQADITPLQQKGWKAPEVFVAKGRDGVTDIWGVIVRPSDFDAQKSYPVIEYIYAGPGDQYVPKSFSPFLYNMTDLAELGFIVVQIDGMGTSYRSKKFEDVCFKNLKDAGFPDRILWMKAAAQKYPYMDIERVGIFGASAGGQESTGAVLFHPEFYKAAYSSCGCHDNRMDKIWWNEQWMSYPIGEQYKESSNVENAHKLTRPLMLVVGEIDNNVDPASTFQVANALVKAGKNFELVVLPGVSHTMGEGYGQHKRFDFFVKNLLGMEPPAWELLEEKRK